MLALTIADRAAPGYGQFGFWRGIGQPLTKVMDGPKDCSRALSKAEFQQLKKMRGASQAELASMFAGAMCEAGIKLEFNPKRTIKPVMKDGRLDHLKVNTSET